jgi:hypothetical protein
MNAPKQKPESMSTNEFLAARLAAVERTIAARHDRRLAYPGEGDWLLIGVGDEGEIFAVTYDCPVEGEEGVVLITSFWVLDRRFVSYDPDTDVASIPDETEDDDATGPDVISIPQASTVLSRELLEDMVAPGWSDRDPD